MSQTYATKLNREHCTVTFDHQLLGALRGRNLSPSIEELWSVGSINHGEDDSGYLLAVVEHLQAQQDEVDLVAAETRETHICGCTGFFHHAFDQQVGDKIDDCKHVERVKEKRRVDIDDQQKTLLP